jgi:transcription antitermination factor NusA-like protein
MESNQPIRKFLNQSSPLRWCSDSPQNQSNPATHDDNDTDNSTNVAGDIEPGQILIKMLVPAYAAGSIIGKNGQTITHLQKETGVCIKLSKAKDFYPGTTERVVLIQGKYEGTRDVVNFVIDKVIEFPIPKDMIMSHVERAKQVKIIVPNTTAGLIIGKKGATVKQIMETTKAKVQLTQKPDTPNMQQLLERVITICGDRDQLHAASLMIMQRIRDDPQSASCPNLSYQNVSGFVANANPTGSPYAPMSDSTMIAANYGGFAQLAGLSPIQLQPIGHGLAGIINQQHQLAVAGLQQHQQQQQQAYELYGQHFQVQNGQNQQHAQNVSNLGYHLK